MSTEQPVKPNPAQERFDRTYITATEISKLMGVSRPAVLRAKQRGFLPEPVHVGDMMVTIWEREAIQPALDAWKRVLSCRKGDMEGDYE